MADYPALPQVVGSTVTTRDDRILVRDTTGTARAASFYTAPKREYTVVHKLDAADLATLRAFYLANRNVTFNFTWCEDASPTACFFGPRGVVARIGAVHHDVTVDIIEA